MKTLFQLFIVIALLYFGCSEDKIINTLIYSPLVDDTTILHTDEFGNILGGDLKDWCSNTPAGTINWVVLIQILTVPTIPSMLTSTYQRPYMLTYFLEKPSLILYSSLIKY